MPTTFAVSPMTIVNIAILVAAFTLAVTAIFKPPALIYFSIHVYNTLALFPVLGQLTFEGWI